MRGLRFIPLIFLAALAWFLFVSEVGSHWLAGFVVHDENDGPVIARIVSATGPFKIVHGGTVEEYTADLKSGSLAIYDGNRIETPKGSTLLLVLNSQDELEVGELSALGVQLWNIKDAGSPIYLQSMNGTLTSRKTGARGRAYIVKDGRLYFPGQKPIEKPLALTVLRSAPLDMDLGESDDGGGDFEPAEAAAPAPAAPEFSGEPQSLSNEYIDEMIVNRQGQLQKCWLSRLKDNPTLKGMMTLQFEISRRGKVRELRVSDTNMNDEPLQRCVLSVIERIPFRSYTGQEITLSYPITFE